MRLLFNILFSKFNESGLYQIRARTVNLALFRSASSSRGNKKFGTLMSAPLFLGQLDHFNGITVNSKEETCEILEFSNKLDESLQTWLDHGRRGIWFKVYLDQADWVPVLAKRNFKFHHAKDDFVMMYLWLPKKEVSLIPQYAHTMVGVGAVVVNDKDQLLVVSEKYYKAPHWKLPGGYVEPGEDLVSAAIREVEEETNIKTEFQTLLSLRHAHQGMFNCSDIYVVVNLKPLTSDIKKCEREIAATKWMEINDYLNHPHIHQLNKFFVQKYLEYKERKIKMDVESGIHQILNKPYTVYYVTREAEEKAGN